jgi:hypothetical protein
MQRAELLAELERLAAEAAQSRVRLAEALGRLRSLVERLGAASTEQPASDYPLHSAG